MILKLKERKGIQMSKNCELAGCHDDEEEPIDDVEDEEKYSEIDEEELGVDLKGSLEDEGQPVDDVEDG